MTTIKIGFNKGLGAMMLVAAFLQIFTYNTTGKGMYLALGFLLGAIGVLQLVATAFVVELHAKGGGEVQVKNPMGMTLRRHEFRSNDDIRVVGTKFFVKRTDGVEKKLGGLAADGSDVRKLETAIQARKRDVG